MRHTCMNAERKWKRREGGVVPKSDHVSVRGVVCVRANRRGQDEGSVRAGRGEAYGPGGLCARTGMATIPVHLCTTLTTNPTNGIPCSATTRCRDRVTHTGTVAGINVEPATFECGFASWFRVVRDNVRTLCAEVGWAEVAWVVMSDQFHPSSATAWLAGKPPPMSLSGESETPQVCSATIADWSKHLGLVRGIGIGIG